ncbi:MAG: hypothetical protein HW398_677, partial [Acidobacteria bacterium]|nr:hypothetical protein [Acidobacteriota bacterium]
MPRVRERFVCPNNAWGWTVMLGLVSLLHSFPFAAETPSPILKEFRQRVWTTEDGLPDNWVHSVLQSRNGYLWIGTGSG